MENVFLYCFWVRGGHITAFTVPVSVGDVELVVVVHVETVHGAQLGELPEDFRRSFELVEHFAGFGVRRSSGAVPECCLEGQGLVGSLPAPKENFHGFFFVIREAHLDNPISSAPLFGFSVSEFINFYSLVAWNPGYVYVGIVVSLLEFEHVFGEKDGELLGWMGVREGDVGDR